jgi:hypothetical protein
LILSVQFRGGTGGSVFLVSMLEKSASNSSARGSRIRKGVAQIGLCTGGGWNSHHTLEIALRVFTSRRPRWSSYLSGSSRLFSFPKCSSEGSQACCLHSFLKEDACYTSWAFRPVAMKFRVAPLQSGRLYGILISDVMIFLLAGAPYPHLPLYCQKLSRHVNMSFYHNQVVQSVEGFPGSCEFKCTVIGWKYECENLGKTILPLYTRPRCTDVGYRCISEVTLMGPWY